MHALRSFIEMAAFLPASPGGAFTPPSVGGGLPRAGSAGSGPDGPDGTEADPQPAGSGSDGGAPAGPVLERLPR